MSGFTLSNIQVSENLAEALVSLIPKMEKHLKMQPLSQRRDWEICVKYYPFCSPWLVSESCHSGIYLSFMLVVPLQIHK